jgi:transketolase
VSTGTQTARVLAAAGLLEASGIHAAVVHVPCLKPLDESALLDALADAPLVVTVEEHTVLGGLGGLVAELVVGSDNRVRVERIGLQDVWGESAPNDYLLDRYGLSPSRVAARIGALVGSLVQRVP